MTSEVKADLKIELSDLNYLCSHASLACKGFPEMIETDGRPIMNITSLETREFSAGREINVDVGLMGFYLRRSTQVYGS